MTGILHRLMFSWNLGRVFLFCCFEFNNWFFKSIGHTLCPLIEIFFSVGQDGKWYQYGICSYRYFTHILLGCFTGTGAIINDDWDHKKKHSKIPGSQCLAYQKIFYMPHFPISIFQKNYIQFEINLWQNPLAWLLFVLALGCGTVGHQAFIV